MTQTTFIQIPLELINYVKSLKLSGTQYDLWLYLFSRDPRSDLPSPSQIATELGVNPRTISLALTKLQELSLLPSTAAVSVREINSVEATEEEEA